MTSPYGALSDELEGLIERVGKAAGPDRQLDCRIQAALIHKERFVTVGPPTYDPERYFCNPDPEMDWIGYDLLNTAPKYTASIDATIALVKQMLPGYRWGVSCAPIKDGAYPDGKTKYADGFKAHLTKSSPLRPMPTIGEARTPALAIILAALRSLQTGDVK